MLQQLHSDILCVGLKPVTLFCSNKSCKQKNTFFCSDIKCRCYQGHKFCSKFHVDVVLDEIRDKVNDTRKYKQKIEGFFRQFYQNLKEIQLKILANIDNNIKYCNLSQIQLKMNQLLIENKNIQQNLVYFNGQILANLMQDIQFYINNDQNNKNKTQSFMQKVIEQVQNLTKLCEYELGKKINRISQVIVNKGKKKNNVGHGGVKVESQMDMLKMRLNGDISMGKDNVNQKQQKKNQKDKDLIQQEKQQQKLVQKQQQKQQIVDKNKEQSQNIKNTTNNTNTKIKKQKTLQLSKQQKLISKALQQSYFRNSLSFGQIRTNVMGSSSIKPQPQAQSLLNAKQIFVKNQQSLQSNNVNNSNNMNNMNNNNNEILSYQDCESGILKNPLDYQNLKKFFTKKQVSNIFLTFRASDNDFSISKYYQTCSDLADTIILVLTQHNKILGGYTPLTLKPINFTQNQLISDQSKSSFLFSLSNNDKFQLNLYPWAIEQRYKKDCIKFGISQLQIGDKCNLQKNSRMSLGNKVYKNGKYFRSQGNTGKEMYGKINGGDGEMFKVKQYEVLKVEFEK